MWQDNQLQYALRIVDAFTGEMPLHNWLRQFFREHKQIGSKDRKRLSETVYNYYRLGHAVRDMPVTDRLMLGLFLCNQEPQELLAYFRPDWMMHLPRPLSDKLDFLQASGIDFREGSIFPWKQALSEGIDHQAFCRSLLVQPDVFLRIRPGFEQKVITQLQSAGIAFERTGPFALRMARRTGLEEVLELDREAVIQDYNSQQVGNWFRRPSIAGNFEAWDACAASGGKSILLTDLYPGVKLTVSDIRESILVNLKQRFRLAGIGNYRALLVDLMRDTPDIPAQDLIIADLPCTGSGTWSRTPEALFFFREQAIQTYATRQRRIMEHVLPRLKKGGKLVYITCSVFREENEGMVEIIGKRLTLEESRMITGYDNRADSMFVASFQL